VGKALQIYKWWLWFFHSRDSHRMEQSTIRHAGMRAQGSNQAGLRIVAFIFGFPGTLLTFLIVSDSGGRAYGIHLPTAGDDNDSD